MDNHKCLRISCVAPSGTPGVLATIVGATTNLEIGGMIERQFKMTHLFLLPCSNHFFFHQAFHEYFKFLSRIQSSAKVVFDIFFKQAN